MRNIRNLCVILISIFCIFGFIQQDSYAIAITANQAASESSLGNYTGSLTYSASNDTSATLTVELTNTSPAANGGFITAFAFNNPGNKITGVSLSSTDTDFGLVGGAGFNNSINAMPFGDFDIGASTGSSFQGSGSPGLGIGVSSSMQTFTFTLTGTMFTSFTNLSFVNELSSNPATGKSAQFFVARFRGFNNGESDKVPGTTNGDVVTTPEPSTIAVLGIGLAGLGWAAVARSRKRKSNKQQ